MIITNVRVSPLKAQLSQPFRIATGQHNSLDNVLLTLKLADGTCGWGEAAVAPHITGETVVQTTKNLKTIAGYLEGQSIAGYLDVCSYARHIFSDNGAAVAAVEMALFDALTRHLQMPLWRLWTPKPRRLATDITVVIGSLEEAQLTAQKFYAQGLRAFKIKIGKDMDLDFKRVQAVARLAPRSMLILDANQGFSAEQTLKFLHTLAKAKIRPAVIEQPVPKKDWDGLKKVTRQSKVLVCADESVSSLSEAVRAVKEKAVGAINIKLMKTGLVNAIEIAHLAQACGIKLMIGGMMESPLAMTASAHLAAGLGGFDFIDLDTPFFIKDGLKGHPCLDRRGVYDLSRIKSGIGIRPV